MRMNAPLPAWLQEPVRIFHQSIPKDFVGQVEVNCFQGGITNIVIRQSYKEGTENASNRHRTTT